MKNNLFKIFSFALIITVLGLIMDGDPKEPSMALRFGEFFAMLAALFTLFSIIYFFTTFALKRFKKITA